MKGNAWTTVAGQGVELHGIGPKQFRAAVVVVLLRIYRREAETGSFVIGGEARARPWSRAEVERIQDGAQRQDSRHCNTELTKSDG